MTSLPTPPPGITFRETVVPCDAGAVGEIVESTGFFNPEEVAIARELVEERLRHGAPSGYHFLFAEGKGRVLGYTCYGHIAGTQSSYDLYWIAVHRTAHRAGLGTQLMAATETIIARLGGRRVYAETSSREQYAPTRHFYERCGYTPESVNTDFYGPGDSKVTYVKILSALPA